MPIQVRCPNPECGVVASVEEQSLGRKGRCKKCGHVFALTRPGGEAASAISGDASAWKGSSPARPAASPTNLPEQFGRYRIMKRLGQGGMGAVYLALDTKLNREVALKVPFFHPADGPQAVQRFEREARAAATLDHPNLCPIHDVGEIDGIHYLTMPYVEGKPLTEAMNRDKTVTEPQAVAVARKLALALQEAHERGVIHRDLKPGNIMVNRRRELIIMDFGLARMAGGDEGALTRTGNVLGTALYMAPEQAAGENNAIGPACDVYSLGVILYELLTGLRPFEGPWSLVIGLKNVMDPPPPSKHRPDLSPALDAICLKAIAKDPKERYQTMAEFAEALNALLRVASGPTPVLSPSGTTHPAENPESLAAQVFAGIITEEMTSLRAEKVPAQSKPAPIEGAPPRFYRRASIIAPAGGVALLLLGIVIYVANYKSWIKNELISSTPTEPSKREQASPKIPMSPDLSSKVDLSLITNTLRMELKLIPAGEFQMGSPDSDRQGRPEERPQHKVRITKPFYLATTEVTVGQFRRFVDENGYQTEAERGRWGNGLDESKNEFVYAPKFSWRSTGFKQTEEHPVVNVTWNDAMEFCAWLSRKEGQTYRLPTEAEWEYSCRAGSSTPFSSGDDPEMQATVGNIADGTAREKYPIWTPGAPPIVAKDGYVFTAPVRRFRANEFGLFDMHGNVWEWCADGYEPGYYAHSPLDDPLGPPATPLRNNRGGSWHEGPKCSRSAYRSGYSPNVVGCAIGFRVARLASQVAGGGPEPLASATPSPRRKWVHSAGYFILFDNRTWEEYDGRPGVGKTYTFIETNKTSDYVELKDNNRAYVRLYNDRCEVWQPSFDKDFKKFYSGNWIAETIPGSVTAQPKDPSLSVNLGNAWYAQGQFDKAKAEYDEAIGIDPKYAIAYGNRGLAWAAKGDLDKAMVDYDKAIHIDPRFADAYCNRGIAWYAKNQFDKAITDYDQTISINPKHALAYENRGNAWKKKGDLDRAKADYREAISIDPKSAERVSGSLAASPSVGKQAISPMEQNPLFQFEPKLTSKDPSSWLIGQPTFTRNDPGGLILTAGPDGNFLITRRNDFRRAKLRIVLAVAKGTEAYLAKRCHSDGMGGWVAWTSRIYENEGKILAGMQSTDFHFKENYAQYKIFSPGDYIVIEVYSEGNACRVTINGILTSNAERIPMQDFGAAGILVKTGEVKILSLVITEL